MQFIGYVTLYIRVEFKNSDSSYCKLQCDFSKPITKRFMKRFLKYVKEAMYKLGFEPLKCSYVTQEEYENSNTEQTISYSWGESEK